MEIKIGDAVTYYDEHSISHRALVTTVHGPADKKPAINLVYVTDDSAKTDPYGRQIERQTSAVYKINQSASGRYWLFAEDDVVVA